MNGVPKESPMKFRDSVGRQEVNLAGKNLSKIPEELLSNVDNDNVTLVNLSNNALKEIPTMFSAYFAGAVSLMIQFNKLTAANLSGFAKLKVLILDDNLLTSLPDSIGELSSLEYLSVSSNKLFTIPSSISSLSSTLRTLNLKDNAIRYVPYEIGTLTNLKILYLEGNAFGHLPCSFPNLNQLTQLSIDWLYYTRYRRTYVKDDIVKGVLNTLRALANKIIAEMRMEFNLKEFVQSLSSNQFTEKWKDEQEQNWLHIACACSHLSVIEALVDNPILLNAVSKRNYSPLGLAIKNRNAAAISLILKAGAKINCGGGPWSTPLQIAVKNFDLWVIKELLHRGANVNGAVYETFNTPLHALFSMFGRNPERAAVIAETLMLAGANPSLRNLEGWAPIHIAAKYNQIKAIEWITKWNDRLKERQGFDLDLYERDKKSTALHIAGRLGHYQLVMLLVQGGASLFARNVKVKTPRQYSIRSIVVYKWLVQAEHDALKRKLNKSFTISPKLLLLSENCMKVEPRVFDTEASIKQRYQRMTQTSAERIVSPSSSTYINRNSATRATSVKLTLLREKVLNNALKLYQRYEALNSLKSENNARKELELILHNLKEVANVGLQLDIVDTACAFASPSILKTLNKLLNQSLDDLIRKKILETVMSIDLSLIHISEPTRPY
eukprot:TRINITY_DN12452_c0_g1_i15.p1 TRINITY_DN12452_c0_g1~~TRINITY_DN12452_c0_g1_i15.p1  ORF type:complete len:715 (-),score=107.45 TRINITY_DN12452_c0_g1_i15:48-2051(-)